MSEELRLRFFNSGLSVSRAARELRISRTHLRMILSGHRLSPSLVAELRRIVDAAPAPVLTRRQEDVERLIGAAAAVFLNARGHYRSTICRARLFSNN